MWEHRLSEKELKLVELLKQQELTKSEAIKKGYDITRTFLLKCELYGVLIYESDDKDSNKKYGVLASKQR